MADQSGEGGTAVASNLTLILGGARSGKSAFAENLAREEAAKLGLKLAYVATGQAFDQEMQARIDQHKAQRGPEWRNVEEPLDVPGVIKTLCQSNHLVLVDCLTLWVTNLLMQEDAGPNFNIERALASLAKAAPFQAPVICVSNEVGLGLVPENALSRRFRDLAGKLHQELAAKADQVAFVAAGLPLYLKETAETCAKSPS